MTSTYVQARADAEKGARRLMAEAQRREAAASAALQKERAAREVGDAWATLLRQHPSTR